MRPESILREDSPMRRLLISLAALLPLAGVAAVQAHGFGGGSETSTQTNQAMVVGSIGIRTHRAGL